MSDPLAPFTAAVEKLSRKDATSILIALCFVFALAAFGIAATTTQIVRWATTCCGVASFVGGLGAFLYSLFYKPDRLRSEETVRMGMLLDWIKRADVDDAHRSSAASLLPFLGEEKSAKRALSRAEKSKDG